jgi:hypothetical protein
MVLERDVITRIVFTHFLHGLVVRQFSRKNTLCQSINIGDEQFAELLLAGVKGLFTILGGNEAADHK